MRLWLCVHLMEAGHTARPISSPWLPLDESTSEDDGAKVR